MKKNNRVRLFFSKAKAFIKYPSQYRVYRKFSAYTMFGHEAYIKNLLLLSKLNKEGCIVECGTWRGGMIAGWASILGNNREYYLFDSFEGLPDATEKDGESAQEYQIRTKSNPKVGWDNCRAEMSFAEEAMKKTEVKNYHLVKGWFDKTTKGFDRTKKIALLHLDGDWYDSIMVCLENLYDSVIEGGLVIIDDYTNWDGCSRAIHDFFSKRDIPEKLEQFNNQITFFIKSSSRKK